MAANYWDSTQARFWTFSKPELAEMRKDLEKANAALHARYALADRRLMNIYMQQQLIKLARRMSLRQQALATAQMYIKRFYLRVEFRRTNPYLIMATAVYLACKMEECPQHIRLMLAEAARQWPELGITESSKIGECEFALISTLSARLICHHPYRTLTELVPLLGLSLEEGQLAHCIINDSYNTDLLLLYPPHVLAITAIFLAVVLRPSGGIASGIQPSPMTHMSQVHLVPSPLSPSVMSPLPLTPTGLSTTLPSPGGLGSFQPALSGNAAQQAFLGGLNGLKPKLGKLVDWLAESKVDMNAIVDATQEMVSLYEVWEGWSERTCKENITRFIRDAASASNAAGPSGLGAK